MATRHDYTPDPEQMALWPEISGNTVNGLDEPVRRRPSHVYWHDPDLIPHGALQRYFYTRPMSADLVDSRKVRDEILNRPIPPVAAQRVERSATGWAEAVKAQARTVGADVVGITHADPADFFADVEVPPYQRVIVIGVAHDYDAISTAPEDPASVEVVNQYGRALKVVRELTGWLHERGWQAHPLGGPMAGEMVMIPAALRAGLGELGKHGSIINRALGSSFRLACVLTDLPMEEDGPDVFGADDFCTNCQVCATACPPQAIGPQKQTVRGVEKWYVDFDRCLPFFNETWGCGICIAVCPWSRPGIAENLVAKMAKRRSGR